MRKARELVREGHVVGVFVEGTRSDSGTPAGRSMRERWRSP